MFGLSTKESAVLRKLSTPEKIQDFLDALPINHEKQGDTCRSPRQVLREQKAHCIEGAMLAAAALWLHGEEPLLLDLTTLRYDDDHVVALYKRGGYWGAISKTNHAVLRFRDPIYRTIRELALSYFHEYFMNTTGQKTLRSYSVPFSLRRFGTQWITDEEDVWHIAEAIDVVRHFPLVPEKNKRLIRKASLLERKVGREAEWEKKDQRT
ncbi:MAG: hypothetical protein WAV46_01075 [Candidatus Moraniibacteriota bacterium]